MLLNLGFGLTVVIALLLLALAFGVSWYGDHLSAAATVNGDTITKDAYHKQLAINAFRTDYMARRIRTLLTAGHLRTADAQARENALTQRTQNAATIALEQLIDGAVMADLAPAQDVSVTDADVDAAFTTEATTPELRHAWLIAVTPTLASGETSATDAEKSAAKAKAEQALADLKAGKDWATVARSVSTDLSKDQGGDIGFIDKDASLDAAFVKAIMAAAANTPTGIIEGADGTYRIGQVTEILAPIVDATLAQQVSDAGIGMDDFRAALRRDVVRQKLDAAITAQAVAPALRRKVAEIYMRASASESGPKAIRVRHILYSPNGDPNAASGIPATDPAWAAAKAKAEAAYQKLKADPSQFDAMARSESDDPSGTTTGGKLPYYSSNDPIDPAFAHAIQVPDLQPGQILPPVQSAYGWHVIQVMHYPTDVEWANHLKQQLDAGTLTFADAARDSSDAANANQGGDMGWVGKFGLSADLEKAIFSAPVGKVSDPVKIDGDGVYLFFVSQEATREPDPAQKASLESSAFSTWYSQQKAGYDITRDPSITATASG